MSDHLKLLPGGAAGTFSNISTGPYPTRSCLDAAIERIRLGRRYPVRREDGTCGLVWFDPAFLYPLPTDLHGPLSWKELKLAMFHGW